MSIFVIVFGIFSLANLCINAGTASLQSQPNILFVLVDDLGWSDVSFHGSKIKTPHVDKLASEGVILNSYYVQPICTPTRAALLSGRYPIHTGLQHGIIHNGDPYGLPLNITTLPQKLKKAGYSTHMIGKWHLGFYNWDSTPTYRGFDTFYGFYSGAEDHYTHVQDHYLDLRDDEEIVRDLNGTYSVNAFAKRAQQIAKSHNSSKPLFLYMAFQNVHGPVQAPKEHVDKYAFIKDPVRRTYAGMVDIMDEAVGNITDAFKEAGFVSNLFSLCRCLRTGQNRSTRRKNLSRPKQGRKPTTSLRNIRFSSVFATGDVSRGGPSATQRQKFLCCWLACENIRFSSLFAAGDVSRRWTSATQRRKFHTDDANQFLQNNSGSHGFPNINLSNFRCLLVDFGKVLCPSAKKLQQNSNVSSRVDYIPQILTPPVPLVDVALYNITADPYEKYDLSKKFPDMVKKFQDRVQSYMSGALPPANKPGDPKARQVAKENGAWTPWM
ncbi:unnamed protein product [Porites evermanni]|uniref:Sulfatase N-terminal domain-containing protein n=1 Tax=Porites evermanni TaxID=104178 RepID=A0ABN8PMS1_9CNID|nr:unnamed protein product [Porites evermanni]